jgi:pimeloyl-ACP methyl ester carboxylesterase
LNWYRCITDPAQLVELTLFDGRRIEAPACYIAGAADWGIFQSPGAFERMQREACARWLGVHLVPGAGHWVQQEQPAQVDALLLEFLQRSREVPEQDSALARTPTTEGSGESPSAAEDRSWPAT